MACERLCALITRPIVYSAKDMLVKRIEMGLIEESKLGDNIRRAGRPSSQKYAKFDGDLPHEASI